MILAPYEIFHLTVFKTHVQNITLLKMVYVLIQENPDLGSDNYMVYKIVLTDSANNNKNYISEALK